MYYENKKLLAKALYYAKLAESESKLCTRKLYCKIASLYNSLQYTKEAVDYYEKALKVHPEYIGWEEDRYLYEAGKLESALALAYFYNRDYEKAYQYGQIAYSQLQTKEAYDNLQYYVNALNNSRKVCIYAICKNEEDNVEKWFNCVKKRIK